MYIDEHGGGCCGARHIFDFDRWSELEERDLKALIETETSKYFADYQMSVDDGLMDRLPSGDFCYECILTDYQLEENNSAWAKALKRLGFTRVARWANPNSGNHCNMFLKFQRSGKKIPYQEK